MASVSPAVTNRRVPIAANLFRKSPRQFSCRQSQLNRAGADVNDFTEFPQMLLQKFLIHIGRRGFTLSVIDRNKLHKSFAVVRSAVNGCFGTPERGAEDFGRVEADHRVVRQMRRVRRGTCIQERPDLIFNRPSPSAGLRWNEGPNEIDWNRWEASHGRVDSLYGSREPKLIRVLRIEEMYIEVLHSVATPEVLQCRALAKRNRYQTVSVRSD